MKERPIIFNGDMVRAIQEGRKTQTRRVMKTQPQPVTPDCDDYWRLDDKPCPYGQPGDRLWVRETCFPVHKYKYAPLFAAVAPDWLYRADYDYRENTNPVIGCHKWTPSIHMPRIASRITLDIVSVRVERLNEINRGDCMQEGCPFPNIARETDPVKWFADLWQSIYGAESWQQNPWMWVVEFKRVQQ